MSVTLLNGGICAIDFAIRTLEYGNALNRWRFVCAPVFNFVFCRHVAQPQIVEVEKAVEFEVSRPHRRRSKPIRVKFDM